jgi:hypothetical protein
MISFRVRTKSLWDTLNKRLVCSQTRSWRGEGEEKNLCPFQESKLCRPAFCQQTNLEFTGDEREYWLDQWRFLFRRIMCWCWIFLGVQKIWLSRGSLIHIVSDYGLDDRGSIFGRGKGLFFSPIHPDRLWAPQSPIQWVPGVLFPGVKCGWGVTLTTHLHLVPRSRMSRSYTSTMACSGTVLLYKRCGLARRPWYDIAMVHNVIPYLWCQETNFNTIFCLTCRILRGIRTSLFVQKHINIVSSEILNKTMSWLFHYSKEYL